MVESFSEIEIQYAGNTTEIETAIVSNECKWILFYHHFEFTLFHWFVTVNMVYTHYTHTDFSEPWPSFIDKYREKKIIYITIICNELALNQFFLHHK